MTSGGKVIITCAVTGAIGSALNVALSPRDRR